MSIKIIMIAIEMIIMMLMRKIIMSIIESKWSGYNEAE